MLLRRRPTNGPFLVLSQTSAENEQNNHCLLFIEPRPKTAPPAFVTHSPGSPVVPGESRA